MFFFADDAMRGSFEWPIGPAPQGTKPTPDGLSGDRVLRVGMVDDHRSPIWGIERLWNRN